jgi:hypothetical protein
MTEALTTAELPRLSTYSRNNSGCSSTTSVILASPRALVVGRGRDRSRATPWTRRGLDGPGDAVTRRHTHRRYREAATPGAVPRTSADSARTRVEAPLDTAARHGIPRNPAVMPSHGTAPEPRSGDWASR